MFDFIEKIKDFFPLCVENIGFVDERLFFSGNGGDFSAACAWRVCKGGRLLYACLDDGVNDLLMSFVGVEIVDFFWIDPVLKIDPSFVFSDGSRLDVFCSVSMDPWVFVSSDGNVYVGNS